MFLRPAKNSDKREGNGLGLWEETYQCIHDERFYPITVRVYYITPSGEPMNMDCVVPDGFEDISIAGYARSSITQQAMQDFMEWAERNIKVKIKDTKLTEEDFFKE